MMNKIIGTLRCPVCKELVQAKEKVILDKQNGITHLACHDENIKDLGSLEEIIGKYPFFTE